MVIILFIRETRPYLMVVGIERRQSQGKCDRGRTLPVYTFICIWTREGLTVDWVVFVFPTVPLKYNSIHLIMITIVCYW